MRNRTLGILAGVISAAVGAWFWTRRRHSSTGLTPARDRGTVIFDNTPTATEGNQATLA